MIFNVGGVNGSIWAYAKFSIFNEKIGHFTPHAPEIKRILVYLCQNEPLI